MTDRAGAFQHPFEFRHRRNGHFADLVRVRIVAGTEVDLLAHVPVAVGPIDDLLGDETLIWNEIFDAVTRNH